MHPSTLRERGDRLTTPAIAVIVVYLVYQVFRPFLVPLLWAAALAICFDPINTRIERRVGRTSGAALTTVIVALAIVVPVIGVTAAFVAQASRLVGDLPAAAVRAPTSAQQWLHTVAARVPGGNAIDVGEVVADALKRAAAVVSQHAAGALQDSVALVLDVAVTLFALFFFFRDGAALMVRVRRLVPLDEDLRERLIRQIAAVVRSSLTAGVLVALAQGALSALAFWAVGLAAPLFWGVVTTLACVLPFGAWVVWAPAAIWLAIGGHVGRGLMLAALGAGIVSSVDNVLRPALMSEHTEMNGLLLFISLLGGAAAFGSVGLVAGPVLVATAMALLDAWSSTTATR